MKGAHSHDHDAALERALKALREAGLKLTTPRREILRTLTREHGPFTMEELHRRMKKISCDLVTVYRSLATLEEVGLVRRCDFGDGSVRYEFLEPGHHHHHLICRNCRRVETLDSCLVEEMELDIRKKGYANLSHSLEFFGVCPVCQKK